MAVWLGGLAALAAVLLPRGDPERIAVATARFSTLAFSSVLTLALTGSYALWRSVGTLPALTDTAYGRLLLGKIAGFCLLIGLGATARRGLHRRKSRPPTPDARSALRGTVAIETCVGSSVLLLTALLVNAEPARTAYIPPVHGAAHFDTGGPNGRGTVSLSVSPARVGYNDIDIAVLDPAGRPDQVAEVDAALLLAERQLGPLPVRVIDVAPGRYQAVTPVAMAGAWQLRVTVRSDQFDETTITFPLPVR
jgi:copper transport protein